MSPKAEEVTRLLHAGLSHPGTGSVPQAALSLVSALCRPGECLALLTSLVSSSSRAADAAAISYHHPLGFDRLTLIDGRPAFLLRIHIWRPMAARGAEHIHNHRFGFASGILYGGYDTQVYAHRADGDEMDEYREGNVGATADWQLERRGTSRIRLVSATRLTRGSSYLLPADTLHRVDVPSDAACATLFLETSSVSATTTVLTEPSTQAPGLTHKEPFSVRTYRDHLTAVIGHLTSLTGHGI